MKHCVAVVLAVLLAANIWSLLNQSRIQHQLEALRSENQKQAEELARNPAISPEDFRTAQAQLDKARVYMDAVESRLTNASAVLDTLQQAAAAQRQPRAMRFPGTRAAQAAHPSGDAFPPETVQGGAAPGPISSSHSPDGQLLQRSWGPEQVLGPPDTAGAGDIPTAWAPRASVGTGEEWLHVNYDRPVDISQINIRETHNPGAISRITAVLPTGQEIVIWEGTEPPAQAPVDRTFAVPPGVQAQSVRVYLDRQRVPGWNEIDAVELVGRDGTRQWASSASASSSYADPN